MKSLSFCLNSSLSEFSILCCYCYIFICSFNIAIRAYFLRAARQFFLFFFWDWVLNIVRLSTAKYSASECKYYLSWVIYFRKIVAQINMSTSSLSSYAIPMFYSEHYHIWVVKYLLFKAWCSWRLCLRCQFDESIV
jgi:hypothetical protein